MRIPADFKAKISDTFYDKEVYTYTVEEVVDDEGWAKMEATTYGSFWGNVRFDNLAKIQTDYGLEDSIDVAITSEDDVETGTVIGYDDRYYMVTKCIPFDSHYLIVGKNWLSKSSTSTSA